MVSRVAGCLAGFLIDYDPCFLVLLTSDYINCDCTQLRRIQALEQERQVLITGLQAVDKAREWYHSQLNSTQEKIRLLGKSTANVSVCSRDTRSS